MNSWKSWTIKSQDVQFGTTIEGVGDGEQKVAIELDTYVLGQNSDHDMKIKIDGKEYKSDVKKLDKNTFNTGVKGRDALRPIKNKISDLLNSLRNILAITNGSLFSNEETELLKHFDDVSPDELCVSNIQKLYKICAMLNEKRTQILKTLPNIKPFFKNDGNVIEMNLQDYYNICLILKQEFQEEYRGSINIILLLNEISHEYIKCPNELHKSLCSLVNIFSEITLIFVDPDKGYYILDDVSKLKFERITRGSPRFRVIL